MLNVAVVIRILPRHEAQVRESMNYPIWISTALKDVDTAIRIVAIVIGGGWPISSFSKAGFFALDLSQLYPGMRV